MLSAAFAMLLMSPFLMLRMSDGTGSFPKPLTPEEEEVYIERFMKGDMEARNILIERNLRLVAHHKGYPSKLLMAGRSRFDDYNAIRSSCGW